MRIRTTLSLLALISIVGCQSAKLPNPNEPSEVGMLSGDNVADQFQSISDSMAVHRNRREINEAEYEAIMRDYASKLLTGYSPDKADPAKAYKYAEVLIAAKNWPVAKATLEIAVKFAKMTKNQDRRVNDSLRLARVYAEMGDVAEAIKVARSTFDAPPEESAPILFAAQYEITRAGRGKGKDIELAHLIEDAIAIDLKVKVNADTAPGILFLRQRPHHISVAWRTVATLYSAANRPDLAAKALLNADTLGHHSMMDQTRKI